jgi:hypothetical protein
MQNYNCVNGQGWLDVCLNTYGSLDYFIKLINDNNLTPEIPPVSNQSVVWDNSLTVNQSIRNTITSNNVIFATYPFQVEYLLNNDGTTMLNNDGNPLING